eukprot:6838115-Alexandrium_andersonii.AAC.1
MGRHVAVLRILARERLGHRQLASDTEEASRLIEVHHRCQLCLGRIGHSPLRAGRDLIALCLAKH